MPADVRSCSNWRAIFAVLVLEVKHSWLQNDRWDTVAKMAIKFEGISETTEPFTLEPGTYVLEYDAKTEEGGSVILQKLVDDGSKWVNAMSPFTATGHIAATQLGGVYRVTIERATGVYVSISASERY